MPQAVVYKRGPGLGVSYLSPRLSITADEAAATVVPDGAPYRIVEVDALPQDAAYQAAWTANFDDEPCVVTVDRSRAAECDRAAERAQLDEWYRFAIEEGFASESGIRLGLSDTDIALLAGTFVLAKEAAAAGLPLPPVFDRHGAPHTFGSIEDLTALMLAYGQYRAQLSTEYAARKAALES